MPRPPKKPCATPKSTAGEFASTSPSPNEHTRPRQASTWEDPPTGVKVELVAAEEVAVTGVAEAADMVVGMTAATAMTVTTEVAVTAEGRPLRTTEAEAAAGVTTGRAPDLIRHVAKEEATTTEQGTVRNCTTLFHHTQLHKAVCLMYQGPGNALSSHNPRADIHL